MLLHMHFTVELTRIAEHYKTAEMENIKGDKICFLTICFTASQ